MKRRGFLRVGAAAAFSPFYTAGVAGQTAARVRPFLQNLKRASVSINWVTSYPGEGEIEIGSQTIRARTKRIAPDVHHHRADITALSAAQRYEYCVRMDGRTVPGCEKLTFRTPGAGVSRIVALGDSGTDSPAQRELARMMIERQPDLMLHTGDLVYPSGTVESYLDKFFAPYAPLLERIPVFPCPGNHDYYHEQANFYVALHSLPAAGVPEEGSGRYYSFEWENAHIVVLDTNTPLEDAAAGRGPMLEWLERDLAQSRHFWKFAMFHHPPFAGGPNQDDPLSHLARTHIVPILEKHGVQLVLNGHEHNYQRSHPLRQENVVPAGDGIVYLTTGGGGAELYPPQPRAEAAFQQGSYHFVEAELQGRELNVSAVRIDGAVIDRLTLRPRPRVDRVVNAASQTPAIASGVLASIHGRQLASSEGDKSSVKVTIRQESAEVVYAAPDLLNVILPAGLTGDAVLRVETATGSAEVEVLVLESAPSVLVADNGFAAVALTDGRPISEARVGDELVLYLTGAGRASRVIVESGEFAVEPPVELAQPGIERVRFRLAPGSDGAVRVVAGDQASNSVAWMVPAAR
jgi:predicted MPP superfamily phosphohydrolase